MIKTCNTPIKKNVHRKEVFEVLWRKKNIANPAPIVPPITVVSNKLRSEIRHFCCTASHLSSLVIEKATTLIRVKYQNKKDINKDF